MNRQSLSRRTVLRGIGASLALPLLDVMLPSGGLSRVASAAAGLPGAPMAAPIRMAAVFLPNGVHYADWEPKGVGSDFALSPTLEVLEPVRDDLLVLSNLCLENATAKGAGPGDHARSAAAFLTGAHPFKTGGSNVKVGVSADQVAAREIGHLTRLPSLELGLDLGTAAGDCDSGYACAYANNVSWSSDSTPAPKEIDPAAVFDRMFGSTSDRSDPQGAMRRLQMRKSILDFVREDAKSLTRTLGAGDRHKMDEYTTSVREIEKRIASARALNASQSPPPSEFARPDGVPQSIVEHIELMWDLLALAFQTDVTRVSTFMIASDGSERHYKHLGISDGHHALSHHENDAAKIEAIKKIDRFHVGQFGRFIAKLKSIKEGEGTLLDNCMIMCAGGIADGNRHNHDALPVLLAGRGGGTITPGRRLNYVRGMPLCNLYVSMLERMGVNVPRFGDSTGPLKALHV
jgi:hypothetical protein